TRGLLHEILLFENLVTAVDLTEPEVIRTFEHSVEGLPMASSIVNLPPGQFLQVSGAVTMTVDCGQPAGSRISNLKIGGSAIAKPGSPTKMYRAAMTSFQSASGGDGYSWLKDAGSNPTRNPAQAQRSGGT